MAHRRSKATRRSTLTPPVRAASRYASISKGPAINGPEAAQIAAHSTRDKKEIHSPAEVLAAHRQIAAEFGNQADQVVTEARRARLRHRRRSAARTEPQPEAQEAVTFARDRSFEREAVTDERDIFRDALRRGMGETTYPRGSRQLRGADRLRRVPDACPDRSTTPGGSSRPRDHPGRE